MMCACWRHGCWCQCRTAQVNSMVVHDVRVGEHFEGSLFHNGASRSIATPALTSHDAPRLCTPPKPWFHYAGGQPSSDARAPQMGLLHESDGYSGWAGERFSAPRRANSCGQVAITSHDMPASCVAAQRSFPAPPEHCNAMQRAWPSTSHSEEGCGCFR